MSFNEYYYSILFDMGMTIHWTNQRHCLKYISKHAGFQHLPEYQDKKKSSLF